MTNYSQETPNEDDVEYILDDILEHRTSAELYLKEKFGSKVANNLLYNTEGDHSDGW